MHDNCKAGILENKHFSRFTFHVLFFIFTALICLSSAVGQSDIGKITGQVIDKKENQPLSQQLVVLQIRREGEEIQQRETVTDDNGVYIFDNLSTAFDVHYAVSTNYEDEEYIERDLVLSEWLPNITVNIEIGAFTDDPSQIRIQHTLIIGPPPADHAPDGAVSVLELIQVENTSELAFQTSIGNQSAGIHFNLPNGHENLQVDQTLTQEIGVTANRLIANQPLAPGTHQIGYSYLMHVVDSDLVLSRKLTFDTAQLYVFISDGMPLVPQSRILGAGRREQIHGLVYTIHATDPAKPLSTNQTVDLRFKVASVAPPSQSGMSETARKPSDPKMIALIAISAALAGGFLVVAIFKIRSPTPKPSDDSQNPQAAPDAGWLGKLDVADLERTRVARLEMITRLEELHEKHEISDRVYERLRKEQADRLAAVLTSLNREGT
jgi:hypothetical protein